MKKLLLATTAAALVAGAASAEDIKLGVILGFTGPLESITPAMASGAELAMKEVTDSGLLLDGSTVTSVRGDSTCVDAAAATAAAERLVTTDKVNAVMGADCSGVTGAILTNVAVPNGVVMISPSATSPGLSHQNNEDNGLFFRTAPSDARQGVVVADILMEKGIKSAAISYTNNDYGKGLADSIQSAFEAAGGTVTINAAHEDGKGDYSAEVGALASAGGDILIVAGYIDQGGSGIVRGALDTEFNRHVFCRFGHGIDTVLGFHQLVDKAPTDGGVVHGVAAAEGAFGFGHDEGGATHAFHATGNHQARFAGLDGACRRAHGIEP
jgi:branched-chain amino acid transport system substrate-binding protein